MPRTPKSREPIHASIKLSLGYDINQLDEEVRSDWKTRKTRVCKPCWELKYCPYGPLVEQSPKLPSLLSDAEQHRDRLAESLKIGMTGDIRKLTKSEIKRYQEWLGDEGLLLRQAVHQVKDDERIAEIMKVEGDQEKITAFLGGELPPIHIYRTPFEIDYDRVLAEKDFAPRTWKKLQGIVASLKKKYADAIATGKVDDRRPLDPVRRLWFQQVVNRFDKEEHPDYISEEFTETECNLFGHICPVFLPPRQ
jgi:hypothetical protein